VSRNIGFLSMNKVMCGRVLPSLYTDWTMYPLLLVIILVVIFILILGDFLSEILEPFLEDVSLFL
jgi:Tfp pilus assembly protein PilO